MRRIALAFIIAVGLASGLAGLAPDLWKASAGETDPRGRFGDWFVILHADLQVVLRAPDGTLSNFDYRPIRTLGWLGFWICFALCVCFAWLRSRGKRGGASGVPLSRRDSQAPSVPAARSQPAFLLFCAPMTLFWINIVAATVGPPWVSYGTIVCLGFAAFTMSLFTIVFFLCARARCIYLRLAYCLNVAHLAIGGLLVFICMLHK